MCDSPGTLVPPQDEGPSARLTRQIMKLERDDRGVSQHLDTDPFWIEHIATGHRGPNRTQAEIEANRKKHGIVYRQR
jgi:hypothetical protein